MDIEQFLRNRGALKCPPAIAKGSRPSRSTLASTYRGAQKHRIRREKKEYVESFEDSDYFDDFLELRNQAPGVFL